MTVPASATDRPLTPGRARVDGFGPASGRPVPLGRRARSSLNEGTAPRGPAWRTGRCPGRGRTAPRPLAGRAPAPGPPRPSSGSPRPSARPDPGGRGGARAGRGRGRADGRARRRRFHTDRAGLRDRHGAAAGPRRRSGCEVTGRGRGHGSGEALPAARKAQRPRHASVPAPPASIRGEPHGLRLTRRRTRRPRGERRGSAAVRAALTLLPRSSLRSPAPSAERSPAPSSGRHPPLGISTARGTRATRAAPAPAPARPRPPRVRAPGAPPPSPQSQRERLRNPMERAGVVRVRTDARGARDPGCAIREVSGGSPSGAGRLLRPPHVREPGGLCVPCALQW